MQPLPILLHLAGVVVWVGGMFFAYTCLGPAVGELEGPQRAALLRRVFARFFGLVWAAIVLILASGGWMMAIAGGAVPASWMVMAATGIVMIAVFLVVYWRAYPKLVRAVDGADWAAAGAALGRIRHLVAVNLGLSVIAIIAAVIGR